MIVWLTYFAAALGGFLALAGDRLAFGGRHITKASVRIGLCTCVGIAMISFGGDR